MHRFDPWAADVLPDPYPFYHRLRVDDPIHWGLAEESDLPGRWYVTRLDDVAAVLKDPRFGREVYHVLPGSPAPAAGDELLEQVARGWMILRDPPVHTRLRALVSRAYTPRMVAQQQQAIADIAHQLVDKMVAAGPPQDLLAQFSLPLTVLVTARMLGLPTRDAGRLAEWSRVLAAVIDLNQTAEIRARSRQAVQELLHYLDQVVADRRRRPTSDLISALLEKGSDGRSLDAHELAGTLTHLLFVGNDPVMHLVGNGVLALLRHPQQLTLLRQQRGLMATAVDELMRFDSSVQMTFRFALTDVELGGKLIRAGDHVALVLGSANRDPRYHPDPDRLDIARAPANLMHFGMGIHYCLGAPLALLEGRIALQILLDRLPDLALTGAALAWQKTAAVRGLTRFPVRF